VEIGDETLFTEAGAAVYVVNAKCVACVQPYPGPGSSATYAPSTDTWTVIESPPAGVAYDAIGWSGRWMAVWGRSTMSPGGSMQMAEPGGSWVYAVGYSPSLTNDIASIVRVANSVVWVHWDDQAGSIDWRQSWAPNLVETTGRSQHQRDICAVEASPGPTGSAVVQCNRVDRLRLLDVVRDRWLDLPAQPKPIVTSIWDGRDLYAISTDGGLLVLR